MRGIRSFTKAEYEWLMEWMEQAIEADKEYGDTKRVKVGESLMAKLKRVQEPREAGANAASLESALIRAAGGKVVPTTRGGYARASRQATQVGATVEQMEEIGLWLRRQSWLTQPVTIIGVLNKWPDWYPKAKATAAPRGTKEGLGGEVSDLRPGSTGGSKSFGGGRPKAGFR